MLLVSVLAAGAFLLGWGYVSRLRCGERGQPGSLLSPARLMDLLPGRSRSFRTPAGAQFWYEWRTLGVVYPLLVIGMLAFVIAPLSWLLRDVPDSPGKIRILVFWTLAMPVMFAHPLGIAISRPSLWGEDLTVPLVSATKPLTAAELVAIRIEAATLGVLLAWLGVLVFLLVLPLWADMSALRRFAADWQDFHQGSAASAWIAATLLFLAAMLLSWRFMISSLWIGLSGSKRLFNGLMALLTAVPVIALAFDVNRLPAWLLAEPTRLTVLVWLTALVVAAKYVLAVVGWRSVAPRLALQYLLIAVAGTVCFVLLWLAVRDVLGTYMPVFGIAQVQTFAILVMLLLVPLARPGFTPAMLARNRHRR
jgi:hypothetical protein